jgi:hypothetical protein
VFYGVLFALLAVLLIVAGVTAISRNRRYTAGTEHGPSDAQRRQRKAKRTQSRQARRKRG